MKPTPVSAVGLAAAIGWYAARFSEHAHDLLGGHAARKILFYQSPMHPWVKSHKPGQCTVCGMELVPIYEGGKTFDSVATDIVMLPQGRPNVMGERRDQHRQWLECHLHRPSPAGHGGVL